MPLRGRQLASQNHWQRPPKCSVKVSIVNGPQKTCWLTRMQQIPRFFSLLSGGGCCRFFPGGSGISLTPQLGMEPLLRTLRQRRLRGRRLEGTWCWESTSFQVQRGEIFFSAKGNDFNLRGIPLKINMEPKSEGLEDGFPFRNRWFSDSMFTNDMCFIFFVEGKWIQSGDVCFIFVLSDWFGGLHVISSNKLFNLIKVVEIWRLQYNSQEYDLFMLVAYLCAR